MYFIVFFLVAAAGVAAFFLHYHFEKKEAGRVRIPRQSLFGLALFCTFVLYLPWVIYSWDPGTGSVWKFLLSLPYMFVRLMQTVSLDADYETAFEIVTLAGRTGIHPRILQAYAGLLFVVSALVPAFGIWTVMGLFRNKMSYWFESSRYCPKTRYYIFNGVGRKNTDLAKSIWEAEGKEAKGSSFIFCNVNEEPKEEILEKIQEIGGVYTQDSPLSLMKMTRYYTADFKLTKKLKEFFDKKIIRYFMLEEEDRNFDDAVTVLKFAKDVDKLRTKNIKIDILLHDNELDNILDAQEKYGIFVRILDVERLYAQELYARWPLFSGLGVDGKEIKIAILGKGSVAEELLLNAVWMGKIDSASLKITYIGEDAKTLERKLRMSCPGLFNSVLAGGDDLKPKFLKIVEDEEPKFNTMDLTEANYVIIAGNNDERNIRTAMWYKTWAARKLEFHEKQPLIAVLVNDAEKAEQAKQLKVQESQEPYDFHVFGTDKEIFCARNLLHSKLMESASRVEFSYSCDKLDKEPTKKEIEKTWNSLNKSVYSFRSSEASALYIVNRLYDSGAIKMVMGKEMGSSENSPKQFSGSAQAEYWYKALYSNEVGDGSQKLNALIEAYNSLIKNDKILEDLARTEHRRWNAYMVSNGWITMTKEETDECIKKYGKHKDYLRLRHATIVPWESLNDVSKNVNKNSEYFKNLDRKIVFGVTYFIVRNK